MLSVGNLRCVVSMPLCVPGGPQTQQKWVAPQSFCPCLRTVAEPAAGCPSQGRRGERQGGQCFSSSAAGKKL